MYLVFYVIVSHVHRLQPNPEYVREVNKRRGALFIYRGFRQNARHLTGQNLSARPEFVADIYANFAPGCVTDIVIAR